MQRRKLGQTCIRMVDSYPGRLCEFFGHTRKGARAHERFDGPDLFRRRLQGPVQVGGLAIHRTLNMVLEVTADPEIFERIASATCSGQRQKGRDVIAALEVTGPGLTAGSLVGSVVKVLRIECPLDRGEHVILKRELEMISSLGIDEGATPEKQTTQKTSPTATATKPSEIDRQNIQ